LYNYVHQQINGILKLITGHKSITQQSILYGVLVTVVVLSTVDSGFEHQSCKTFLWVMFMNIYPCMVRHVTLFNYISFTSLVLCCDISYDFCVKAMFNLSPIYFVDDIRFLLPVTWQVPLVKLHLLTQGFHLKPVAAKIRRLHFTLPPATLRITRCCTLRRAKNTPTRSFVSRTVNRK
jgi:hypothetical protein